MLIDGGLYGYSVLKDTNLRIVFFAHLLQLISKLQNLILILSMIYSLKLFDFQKICVNNVNERIRIYGINDRNLKPYK